MEDILVPLFFFTAIFGFPLARRAMIHRHRLELLTAQAGHVPPPDPAAPGVQDDAPALALRLPEPHRLYALALLCRIEDAPATLHPQSRALLDQIRLQYLPGTLGSYLNLTATARAQLRAVGRDPEHLLREQLELLGRGAQDALQQDHTAADRLLSQGYFLRDRFTMGDTSILNPAQPDGAPTSGR